MVIRVFIADDHAIVREGLELLLASEKDIEVIGWATNGREAVEKVMQSKPDVLIMDIMMPELNGIEASRAILDRFPDLRIIILSMKATSEHINRALKAGVFGYLLKESAGKEVIEAVRTVVSGGRYLSQKISNILLEDMSSKKGGDKDQDALERLSQRERQILKLVVDGNTSLEIGNALNLSPKTVETYRSRLMAKLGVRDIPSLVKFAIQHGITSLT